MASVERQSRSVEIYLFGSRADRSHNAHSDFDICLKGDLTASQVDAIHEELQKLNTLKMIDISMYRDLDSNFKRIIDRKGILLNGRTTPEPA